MSELEEMNRRMDVEYSQRPDFVLPMTLDITATLVLISHIQIALTHPNNMGPEAEMAKTIADRMIAYLEQHGFPAHAEVARLGFGAPYNNPPHNSRKWRTAGKR